MLKKPTFEECIDVIDTELIKRRAKWKLTGMESYEDISQMIRLHIWKKWHLYDPSRPLTHWIQRIITNQLKNLTRNYSVGGLRPCNSCIHNLDGDFCDLYEIKCSKCPLYKKWKESAKMEQDVRMPVSLENHSNESDECSGVPELNWEKTLIVVHQKMLLKLQPYQQEVYKLCYVEGLDDKEAAKLLGYTNAKVRKGIIYIKNVKTQIAVVARKVVTAENLDL